MKVIAFGASSSSTSINKALATYAAHQIEGADVTVLNITDYDVPMYSEDKEKETGIPAAAKEFKDTLASADALVISFAEHNGSYPSAYKNLFDWASRIDRQVYGSAPAVYLAASPGPTGAKNVLAAAEGSAGFFGGEVKATVSVANFYDNFDLDAGKVTNPEIDEEIKAAVAKLA